MCFNRKLDAHITQRKQALPGLVLISGGYGVAGESQVLPHCDYVEVTARKTKKGKQQIRPDERLCDRLSPAIYADGIDKGRLVNVCADKSCPVHFRERREQEKHDWRAGEKACNLYRRADGAGLAALIFEAVLVGPAGDLSAPKEDDPSPMPLVFATSTFSDCERQSRKTSERTWTTRRPKPATINPAASKSPEWAKGTGVCRLPELRSRRRKSDLARLRQKPHVSPQEFQGTRCRRPLLSGRADEMEGARQQSLTSVNAPPRSETQDMAPANGF